MLRSLSCLVVGLACLAAPGRPGVAADDRAPEATKLDGAWRMTGSRAAEGDEYAPLPEGFRHIKLVAGGRFVWTTAQGGKILQSAGGKCSVKGDQYTEVIEYTLGEGVEGLAGKGDLHLEAQGRQVAPHRDNQDRRGRDADRRGLGAGEAVGVRAPVPSLRANQVVLVSPGAAAFGRRRPRVTFWR